MQATHPVDSITAGDAQAFTVAAVCKAAGDPLRASILKVLARDSFGVLELCELFDMAQPAMSHHLKCLLEAGLVEKRPEGTFVFYQRTTHLSDFTQALFASLDDESFPEALAQRIQPIYEARAERSLKFFEHNADALAQQRALVCQADVYAQAVVGACERLPDQQRRTLLEVGPGDGALLARLAGLFDEIRAIDTSHANLQSAQAAAVTLPNVTLDHADFLKLPGKNQFDALVAAMVIHHLASPELFFQRAARQLRDAGLLVVAELSQHQQQWVTEACGDVWLGFSPDQLISWASAAGFTSINLQHLAQRNGFNVQVHAFQLKPLSNPTPTRKGPQHDRL